MPQCVGAGDDQSHRLDTQSRVDPFQFLVQHAAQMARVAGWAGGADAKRGDGAVDAFEQQVQPACALPGMFQSGADRGGQARDDGRKRNRRQQRFHERQSFLNQLGRDRGNDRFEHRTECLIQARGDDGPEPPHQWPARGGNELADPVESHQPQPVADRDGEAEGFDREGK